MSQLRRTVFTMATISRFRIRRFMLAVTSRKAAFVIFCLKSSMVYICYSRCIHIFYENFVLVFQLGLRHACSSTFVHSCVTRKHWHISKIRGTRTICKSRHTRGGEWSSMKCVLQGGVYCKTTLSICGLVTITLSIICATLDFRV